MSNGNSKSNFIDFYEFLMVSPDADKPMIEWAVRLLATRFGKKNGEYVDEAKYNLVRLAFRTLSDPAKRAAFDALRAQQSGSERPAKPEESSPAAESESSPAPATASNGEAIRRSAADIKIPSTATVEDARAQQRLRQGIVASLYDILVTRPRNPELGRAEVARLTGVINDDLEFPLWYLREKDLLRTTPAGLYTLSAKGVEWAENGGVEHLLPADSADGASEDAKPELPAEKSPKMREAPALTQPDAPQQVA